MPIVSIFQGIKIYMQSEKGSKHNAPHIHAVYGEYESMFDLDGEALEGKLPNQKTNLVKGWIALHVEDLKINWELALAEEPIFRIDGLRQEDIMTEHLHPIIKAEPLDDYKLKITFKTGEIRIADFKPHIQNGKMFKPLENPDLFKKVKANGYSRIEWTDDIDFCGGCLYSESIPYADYIKNIK